MLRLEDPIYFYTLLIAITIGVLAVRYLKYNEVMMRYFSVKENLDKKWRRDMIWYIAGCVLISLALVNPQYGYRKERVQRESADIYIALDISQSMLAEDLSPSRIERARKIGEYLIDELKTERIGLIFFAGEAYMQMPLTTDYRSALVFLRTASPSQAGIQGTAIADAIAMAAKRDDIENNNNRIAVIISDGEDHEGAAAEAAKEALNSGTAIFTVGIGTEEGGFIPVMYGNQADYLRDQSGEPVRTRLNRSDLEQIAVAGGGSYFEHNVGNSMYEEIKEKVKRLERRNFEKTLFTARESYFQWFLFLGIIFLSLPFILKLKRKNMIVLNR